MKPSLCTTALATAIDAQLPVFLWGKGRKCCYFQWDGCSDMTTIDVGSNPRLLREVRKLTDEVWPVYERAGKWWSRKYYLVPSGAIRAAKLAHPEVFPRPMTDAEVEARSAARRAEREAVLAAVLAGKGATVLPVTAPDPEGWAEYPETEAA